MPLGGILSDVTMVLLVCRANTHEIYMLEVMEQFSVLAAFGHLKNTEITQLAIWLEKWVPPISLHLLLVMNIHALCFWASKVQ